MQREFVVVALAAISLWGVGCDRPGNKVEPTCPSPAVVAPSPAPASSPASDEKAPAAIAVLRSAADANVQGAVRFQVEGDHLLISAEVTGLSPTKHGFHVHETGDCSEQGFSSAGGHFAPMNLEHGSPRSPRHHAGDLGNLYVDGSGVARVFLATKALTLGTEPTSIVGRSVIVHAGADDFKSQPSGAAGQRLACGVIERANG